MNQSPNKDLKYRSGQILLWIYVDILVADQNQKCVLVTMSALNDLVDKYADTTRAGAKRF